jgi:DNA excision repair protein ERCC-4
MQLVVDVHERRSGVPDALRAMRVSFNEQPLSVGDYVVGDVVIERKTVPDLHGSVLRGRFWGQIGRLRKAGKWRYLIIEGQSPYEGPLRTNAVRGLVLAVNELAVTVLRTATPEDSAGWIAAIGKRRDDGSRSRDRPIYAQRPQRDPHFPPAEQALAAAPGVSTTSARALLSEFGSLINVLLASPDDLRRVPGVGLQRARAIHELASSTSDSGVSRNCLST